MTLQLNEQEHQLLKNVLHALYKTFHREPGMNIGSCQCSNVYPDDLKTLIDLHDRLADGTKQPERVWVLYEVDEEDNTKSSIVAMTDADWKARKPETIEKVLRDYFDERYADCDDEYFCYEDEIKQAVEALTTGYDTEFNGDSLFWDEVEMM